jgi:2-dehydro-3-deoxygluconokinase
MRGAITQMLALTDIALPSFDDEARHFGDADPAATIARLQALGVAEVVVKDGPDPVHLMHGGTAKVVPTPPVSGIRDTTGAGDAFNAGYLAARVLGCDAAQAVRAGQRMAAIVLQHFGARAGKEALAVLPAVRDV